MRYAPQESLFKHPIKKAIVNHQATDWTQTSLY
jgi:hypothetical protein